MNKYEFRYKLTELGWKPDLESNGQNYLKDVDAFMITGYMNLGRTATIELLVAENEEDVEDCGVFGVHGINYKIDNDNLCDVIELSEVKMIKTILCTELRAIINAGLPVSEECMQEVNA